MGGDFRLGRLGSVRAAPPAGREARARLPSCGSSRAAVMSSGFQVDVVDEQVPTKRAACGASPAGRRRRCYRRETSSSWPPMGLMFAT
jgi:hypothetical protein